MAEIKKYRIHRVTDVNGTLEVVHPETDETQVLVDQTIGSKQVSTLQEALSELSFVASSSGVTGVKGSAESTYRTGNVSLSPANIGAVASNSAITAGTATKITYDSKGLVTKGEQVAVADISGLSTELAKYVPLTQKGANNGVATLDSTGKVPTSQLPSYVDDVIEYASKANFPTTGEEGKIYIAKDTNLTYRWGGTAYVEISPSLALGETSSTAYAGDKGKANATAIASLQTQVANITNGTTKVPNATNADKLGNVNASSYALKTDLPDDELFVVNGTISGSTVTLTDGTYSTIKTAIDSGKIPVLLLKMGTITYTFDYEKNSSSESFVFVNLIDYTLCQVTITSSTSTFSSVNFVSTVTQSGSGFVSDVSKTNGNIAVTKRALTNDDLPASGVTAGQYSAVNVNAKGVVTAGGSSIEWGTSGQTSPSDSLMVGGIFFQFIG